VSEKILDVFTNSTVFGRDTIWFQDYELRICNCADAACFSKMFGKIWIIWNSAVQGDVENINSIIRDHPIGRNGHLTVVGRAEASAPDNIPCVPSRDLMLKHFEKLLGCGINIGYSYITNIEKISIDSLRYKIYFDGVDVRLGLAEFRLARYLIGNANRLVTFSELQYLLYASGSSQKKMAVQKQISRLREALSTAGASNLIRTVRGEGYVIDII